MELVVIAIEDVQIIGVKVLSPVCAGVFPSSCCSLGIADAYSCPAKELVSFACLSGLNRYSLVDFKAFICLECSASVVLVPLEVCGKFLIFFYIDRLELYGISVAAMGIKL